ncbi:PPC domain-containing protein [Sporosarcina sp. Marseille-Q4943]|uniref:PPC domain-containing protein n=1 Tax=Sporosarcina sp. Marseille-Q4943 TaxID=2942204 RepID=UPI00208DCB34|nr:PPC domain-containing protein [Sporosarcina sp. Marseille-Q4943]
MKRLSVITFLVLFLTIGISGQTLADENKSLSSGVPFYGEMTSNTSVDTFVFTTEKDGGEVYITLEDTTGGFHMTLYDANGNSVGLNFHSKAGGMSDISKTLAKGTYTLKVKPHNWSGISSASYKLKATYASAVNSRDSSTFEPNDTIETSMDIKSGVAYKSSSESYLDIDTYQFTTDKDGEVYILLDEATGGYHLTLYDDNGNRVGLNFHTRAGDVSYISKKLAKGTYYVKVKPHSWSGITSANYRLKATYASAISRNKSTFEPNDTMETSMAIKSGISYKSISETFYDIDTYQFTTTADGEVNIVLDETTGGFYLKLYDANGNAVTHDFHSKSGGVSKISRKLAKGTYYIKVTPYSWSGITSANYKLKATFKEGKVK